MQSIIISTAFVCCDIQFNAHHPKCWFDAEMKIEQTIKYL